MICSPVNLHFYTSAAHSEWDVPVLTSDDLSFAITFFLGGVLLLSDLAKKILT